jgi:hypothetical protein
VSSSFGEIRIWTKAVLAGDGDGDRCAAELSVDGSRRRAREIGKDLMKVEAQSEVALRC